VIHVRRLTRSVVVSVTLRGYRAPPGGWGGEGALGPLHEAGWWGYLGWAAPFGVCGTPSGGGGQGGPFELVGEQVFDLERAFARPASNMRSAVRSRTCVWLRRASFLACRRRRRRRRRRSVSSLAYVSSILAQCCASRLACVF
jgi:hypothetical protein